MVPIRFLAIFFVTLLLGFLFLSVVSAKEHSLILESKTSFFESIAVKIQRIANSFARLFVKRDVFTAQLIPAPELVVYDDSLSGIWTNVSYGGTFYLQNKEQVWRGTASIKAQTDGGGALSFRVSKSPQSISLYKTFNFAIYPSTANFEVMVGIEGEMGLSSLISLRAPMGKWTPFSISLNEFSRLSNNVSRIYFITPAAQNWYLDDVKFVGVATYREPPRDFIPPTVAISSPTAGKILTGEVIVSATSSDNVGVASVRFLLDGKPLGEATSSPYSIRWRTASSTNGIHILTAIARDTSGNEAVSTEVKVEVKNPEIDIQKPTVKITTPSNDTTFTGKIPITVEAKDNIGVVRVEIFAQKISPATSTLLVSLTGPPYSYIWDASKFDGDYLLLAKAYDAAGNFSTSSGVMLKVIKDTIPPAVALERFNSDKPLKGTVTVFATSSDNVGVASVRFKLNGTYVAEEDTSPPFSFSWDTTQTANGFHKLTAVAKDTAGNISLSSPLFVEVANPPSMNDSSPLVVYLDSPSSDSVFEEDSITIRAYASSSNGIAGVRFRLNGVAFSSEDTSPPYEVSWNTSLFENGSYLITAEARDRRGNKRVSWPIRVTLRRVAPPKDTAPPTVFIQSPLRGSTLSGTTTIVATVTDNVGVKEVEFKVDGITIGKVSGSPYSYVWDTNISINGIHKISVFATDLAGNKAFSEEVAVIVKNTLPASTAAKSDSIPPRVSLISPAPKNFIQTVSSTITLEATSSDNVAVAGVRFKLNGTNFGQEINSPPYKFNWDTKLFSNGHYIITAVARDTAGNLTVSTPVTVNVSNIEPPPDKEPPVVFIISPRQNDNVSGKIELTANALDNVGVEKVEFKADGVFVGEKTTPPFKVTWDTKNSADGIHIITAVAYDKAGNKTVSNPVSVLVKNPAPVLDRTPPYVSITFPRPNSFVSSTIFIEATSTDNVGVAGVIFKLDGHSFWQEVTNPPFRVKWDTSLTENGRHVLTAVARDELYNTSVSKEIVVDVNNK